MTTPSDFEARALLIKKLLHKAEARGTTEAERDLLNAKATELMLKWGIEEAMLADVDRTKVENIVQKYVATTAPKSYQHEIVAIGIEVARAFGCRGILAPRGRGETHLCVVGFESDVERVLVMFQSLMIQCAAAQATWYSTWPGRTYGSGTDKFNAKRSFIRGFAQSVGEKLATVKKNVEAAAAPGTDLVLVDRSARVSSWVNDNMRLANSRGRSYGTGWGAGTAAGQRANIGGTGVGGGRQQIEG